MIPTRAQAKRKSTKALSDSSNILPNEKAYNYNKTVLMNLKVCAQVLRGVFNLAKNVFWIVTININQFNLKIM